MSHFETYRVTLEALSPLHVGSDAVLEPFEYDLFMQERVGQLVVYDLDKVLGNLTAAERREFCRLADGLDVLALRQWIRRHADRQRHKRFQISVQPDAYQELKKHQEDLARSGEMFLFLRHPGGEVYVPGSSVKGAVRTALVEAAANEPGADSRVLAECARDAKRSAVFEGAALGHRRRDGKLNLYRDPLRQLGFSDLAAPADPTVLERIEIVRPGRRGENALRKPAPGGHRGGRGTAGICIYREITWSLLDDEEVQFEGELRLFGGLTDERRMKPNRDGEPTVLPRIYDVETLCAQCTAFYRPKLEAELARFPVAGAAAAVLRRAAHNLAGNQCLVRLGRHSHIECMTLGEKYRQARGYGRSRSYTSAGHPLGWARLSFVPIGVRERGGGA